MVFVFCSILNKNIFLKQILAEATKNIIHVCHIYVLILYSVVDYYRYYQKYAMIDVVSNTKNTV